MRLYPIQFKPIFKPKIWGSRHLARFLGTSLPGEDPIGESIHLVDRPGDDEMSVVDNGWSEGTSLQEVVEKAPDQILGPESNLDSYGRFPLMIKFLNARKKLSLQVHPGDEYANMNEDDEGKFEAWYIIDADEDAQIIRGVLPDVTPDDLVDAIRNNKPLDVLNCIDVRDGDVILIPPGIVHSIGGDVLLCEVEQNSDVTYRIHDWNRLGPDGQSRQLHLNKALDVIDFQAMGRTRTRSAEVEGPWKNREILVRTPKFKLEKLTVDTEIPEEHPGKTFHLITCIGGSGRFLCGSNENLQFAYSRGDCFLMPAGLGDYRIEPDAESVLLKTSPE